MQVGGDPPHPPLLFFLVGDTPTPPFFYVFLFLLVYLCEKVIRIGSLEMGNPLISFDFSRSPVIDCSAEHE